jgi:hypothetical protein
LHRLWVGEGTRQVGKGELGFLLFRLLFFFILLFLSLSIFLLRLSS